MKRMAALLLVVVWGVSVSAVEPRYIGTDKCAKMCHKGPKKGSQYEIHQKGTHAQAFQTLGTDTSKIVAQSVNVTGDPQKAPECLRCHVTAYGQKNVDTSCTYNEGVGCEACHGPGSEYRKLNVMKKHDMAMAAGLWEPTEAVCTKCHNKESPTYKPFTYSKAVKLDAHPIPEKTTKK